MPPKFHKVDNEKSNNDTAKGKDTNAAQPTKDHIEHSSPIVKPEHLLELQEKITKEILSTKLEENEMHELQVIYCLLIKENSSFLFIFVF